MEANKGWWRHHRDEGWVSSETGEDHFTGNPEFPERTHVTTDIYFNDGTTNVHYPDHTYVDPGDNAGFSDSGGGGDSGGGE